MFRLVGRARRALIASGGHRPATAAAAFVPSRGIKRPPRPVTKKGKPKPVYTPVKKETVLPKGHPLTAVTVVPHNPKEVFSLNCKTRSDELHGKYAAPKLRGDGYITGQIITNEHKDAKANQEAKVSIMVPIKEWDKIVDACRVYNSIINVFLDGQETPIKVLTTHYQDDLVSDRPLNICFIRWRPGAKFKIGLPVVYENYYDSPTLKKGGMVHDLGLPWGWPCWWQSDSEEIPSHINIDLLHTRIGWNYKLLPVHCPDGLRIRKPHTSPNFVLCTIQGKIKRGVGAVEDADEE